MSALPCDVCIGGYDGDPADIYCEQFRTARKPHKCGECFRLILPGERYEYISGRWDGEFDSFHFCSLCSEIGRVFSCGQGRTFGCLWDDMEEAVFPNLTTKSPCFRLLSVLAKHHVLGRWRRWKGLCD